MSGDELTQIIEKMRESVTHGKAASLSFHPVGDGFAVQANIETVSGRVLLPTTTTSPPLDPPRVGG